MRSRRERLAGALLTALLLGAPPQRASAAIEAPAAEAEAPAETPEDAAAPEEPSENPDDPGVDPLAEDPTSAADEPTEVSSDAPLAVGAVAILPLRVDGELPAHVRATMVQDLKAAVEAGEREVIPADEVEARSPVAQRCEVAQCFQTIAETMKSRYLVLARVTVVVRDYEFSVTLIDGVTGEPVANTGGNCDICGHDEAREGLANAAAALSRKIHAATSAPPTFVVQTTPAGAQVRLDGRLLGVTPLEVVVEDGEHDIVVEKPGYIAARRRIAFVDGVTETLALELVAMPAGGGPEHKESGLLRALGWTGVGLSVGALAGGAVMIALEERPITSDCDGANVDDLGNCKWRYKTLEGGIALVVTGVALAATGATLLVLDRKRRNETRDDRRASARVRTRLGAGGLELRF
ncbi:MAG: PEGA domain-containing protein [Myxococcales bacterium]|nr:PEGA domain-containing protein [Myxococcales bacterium]